MGLTAPGTLEVEARCGDEPIRVGTFFRGLESSSNYLKGAELVKGEVTRFDDLDAQLTGIECYGKELEELDAGMSGKLTFRTQRGLSLAFTAE